MKFTIIEAHRASYVSNLITAKDNPIIYSIVQSIVD